jgi:hypothetical protein
MLFCVVYGVVCLTREFVFFAFGTHLGTHLGTHFYIFICVVGGGVLSFLVRFLRVFGEFAPLYCIDLCV